MHGQDKSGPYFLLVSVLPSLDMGQAGLDTSGGRSGSSLPDPRVKAKHLYLGI